MQSFAVALLTDSARSWAELLFVAANYVVARWFKYICFGVAASERNCRCSSVFADAGIEVDVIRIGCTNTKHGSHDHQKPRESQHADAHV